LLGDFGQLHQRALEWVFILFGLGLFVFHLFLGLEYPEGFIAFLPESESFLDLIVSEIDLSDEQQS
jgi:hypothetical protein